MGNCIFRIALVLLLMACAPRGLWAYKPVSPKLYLGSSSNKSYALEEIERDVIGVVNSLTKEVLWQFNDDRLHGTYFVNNRGDTVFRIAYGNMAYLFATRIIPNIDDEPISKKDRESGPYCMQVFRKDQCLRQYTAGELCYRIQNHDDLFDDDHGPFSKGWLASVAVIDDQLEMITEDEQRILFDMDTGEIIGREYLSTPRAIKPYRLLIALGVAVILLTIVVIIAKKY